MVKADNLKLEISKKLKLMLRKSQARNKPQRCRNKASFIKVENQFSDANKNQMQELVKNAIESIEAQSIGVEKIKKMFWLW